MSENLALKKELLRLRLDAHRLEIATDIAALRNPLRSAAIGGSLVRLLRSHPILVSGASALLSRVPKLGFAIKVAAAGMAIWQLIKLINAFRR